MVNTPRKYMTIGEIDATGVRGPHEKELTDVSKAKHHLFINLEMNKLKEIVEEVIGGKMENIGFNEDWTITIEMFPEVNIHMIYSYFGDEFGDGIEAEFKFFFSGERVFWVPGEDSATFIDIIMDIIERKIKGQEPYEKKYEEKTELMKKVLLQSAKILKTETGWRIKKEFFPEIVIEIIWDAQNHLDIKFSGTNLSKNIDSYHVEFIGIFLINHILRFITVSNIDKDLPDICYIMFSRYYTKNIGKWDHRVR